MSVRTSEHRPATAQHSNPYNPWPERVAVGMLVTAVSAASFFAETKLKYIEAGMKGVGIQNPLAQQAWPHRLPEVPRPTLPAAIPGAPTLPKKQLSIGECVAKLPLDTKTGQLIMAGVNGDNLKLAQAALQRHDIGGAVIMSPVSSLDKTQLDSFKHSQKIPLWLATDEEGGSVQRFKNLGVLPSATEMAASQSPEAAKKRITAHGLKLRALGIDVVFGPVADVGPADGSVGPMQDRVFSTQPDIVSQYVQAYVQGWQDAGILPVEKHFPGHGSASADTHTTSKVMTPPVDVLRSLDWVPYQNVQSKDNVGIMVGHLIVPGLGDAPASVNQQVITGELRGELGYQNNLVFSDSITMAGVGLPLENAAEAVIEAGGDVIVSVGQQDVTGMDNELSSMQNQLHDAVVAGRLSEARVDESATRVLTAKHFNPCAQG